MVYCCWNTSCDEDELEKKQWVLVDKVSKSLIENYSFFFFYLRLKQHNMIGEGFWTSSLLACPFTINPVSSSSLALMLSPVFSAYLIFDAVFYFHDTDPKTTNLFPSTFSALKKENKVTMLLFRWYISQWEQNLLQPNFQLNRHGIHNQLCGFLFWKILSKWFTKKYTSYKQF